MRPAHSPAPPQVFCLTCGICAALYPAVVQPTLTATKKSQVGPVGFCRSVNPYLLQPVIVTQDLEAHRRQIEAGFVKKGMWKEMHQSPDRRT